MGITQWSSTDKIRTQLSSQLSNLQRIHKEQKDELNKTRTDLDKSKTRIKKQEEEINELSEEVDSLNQENDKLKNQIDRLKDKIFKISKHNKTELRKKQQEEEPVEATKKSPSDEDKDTRLSVETKRGARKNHKGYGRRLPDQIDETRRIYMSNCPCCHNELSRSSTTHTHTVEDIPDRNQMKTKTIRYDIERQWCKHCKKEVRTKGRSFQLLSHMRFGINLLVQIMLMRYQARMSIATIKSYLATIYGLPISEGGIINQLKKARKYLKPVYDNFLQEIRDAPIKHADETGWRVQGINCYLWAFLTGENVYLKIEDNRGKEIAIQALSGSSSNDVLVRDDYGGYKNIPMKHQSCWAHLLRFSHEVSTEKGFSEEAYILHKRLKGIFDQLEKVTETPFDRSDRREQYHVLWDQVKEVIDERYVNKDSRRIQTRVQNQSGNLLTAVMNEGVPLTNNEAERAVRPSVIIRKISGSCQSWSGADTHAINMSVYQTLQKRKLPLYDSLASLLSGSPIGKL